MCPSEAYPMQMVSRTFSCVLRRCPRPEACGVRAEVPAALIGWYNDAPRPADADAPPGLRQVAQRKCLPSLLLTTTRHWLTGKDQLKANQRQCVSVKHVECGSFHRRLGCPFMAYSPFPPPSQSRPARTAAPPVVVSSIHCSYVR